MTRSTTEPGLGHWDPLRPIEVARALDRCSFPWWIAGGFAIDAFLGQTDRREHDDIDVGILARDQGALQAHLGSWDLHCVDPPGSLRPWRTGEILEEPVHDVWARARSSSPWRLQVLLNPGDAETWIYRRDARIRRDLSDLVWWLKDIPYLAPEVQLLFKSTAVRPKDERDFTDSLPRLTASQRSWLREKLQLTQSTHPWLRQL